MCIECGSCDHEPILTVDSAADWIYNDIIFGKKLIKK